MARRIRADQRLHQLRLDGRARHRADPPQRRRAQPGGRRRLGAGPRRPGAGHHPAAVTGATTGPTTRRTGVGDRPRRTFLCRSRMAMGPLRAALTIVAYGLSMTTLLLMSSLLAVRWRCGSRV